MTTFQAKSGIVMTEVCGEYLLVSPRSLHNECPYVTQINETSAFLWNHMQRPVSEEDLFKAVQSEYEIDDMKEALESIRSLLADMSQQGYLLKQEV